MQKILYLGKKSEVSQKYEEMGYVVVYPKEVGISPYKLMESIHTTYVVMYSENIVELIESAFRACYYLRADAKLLLCINETKNPCFKKNVFEVKNYESLFQLQNTESNLWTIPFVTKKHNELILEMMMLKHSNPCIKELLAQFGTYEKTVEYCRDRIGQANRKGYDIEIGTTEVPILKQSVWRIVSHYTQEGETIIEGDSPLDRYKYRMEQTPKDIFNAYINLVYYEKYCTDIAEQFYNTTNAVLTSKNMEDTIAKCHPEPLIIPRSACDEESTFYDELVQAEKYQQSCY